MDGGLLTALLMGDVQYNNSFLSSCLINLKITVFMRNSDVFVKKYYKNIVDKWVNFFIYKKRIRSTKITKKL